MGEVILVAVGFAASLYGLIRSLMTDGLFCLSYFTLLSDVMVVVAMSVRLIQILKGQRENHAGSPAWGAFRFIQTLSITVTFLVFLFLLAPTSEFGFIGAYQDNYYASLCMHMIAPLCVVPQYFIYDRTLIPKKMIIPYSVLFPVGYVIYAVILGQCGMRWTSLKIVMPYNFLNYKAPCGWFGLRLDTVAPDTLGIGVAYMILILALAFVLVGALIYIIKKKVQRL